MSKEIQDIDEEILWQLNIKLHFQTSLFLTSLVILAIGIISQDFFTKFSDYPPDPVGGILLGILATISILIISFPLIGIMYAIFVWLWRKYMGNISYIVTNKKIIDKREKKEYIEYFTFEYTEIKKIEIRKRIFFKNRGVFMKIFPKFTLTSPFKWSFQFFKDSEVKFPQYPKEKYHQLYNVSKYKPLLEILEQNHVKIIKK